MGSVGFPLKLSACILIFLVVEGFCDHHEGTWCYDKPNCGPKTWGSLGFCNGRRQSPINIDTKAWVHFGAHLGPIKFIGYENRRTPKQLKNNGRHLEVDCHPGATISTSSLSGVYFLNYLHVHWGTEDGKGSEHTIDGQQFSMELHLVHTKNGMSIKEALKDSGGVAILAILVQISQNNVQNPSWDILANFVQGIPERGNSRVLNGEFSMRDLLGTADVSRYYTYNGSLTTPNCDEVATWFVFQDVIKISPQAHKKFVRSLYFTTINEGRQMQNNFRPVQPLNDRRVYYYQEKAPQSCVARCLARCSS